MRTIACLILACALAGCATYTDSLNRAERHYQASDYERALSSLKLLEADIDSLTPADRARYAYLRGMADYRMSFRADARHWLALARVIDKANPGGLQPAWRQMMTEALADLDGDVRGGTDAVSESEQNAPFAPQGL